MGFSPKRAKAVAKGKVKYCIMLDGNVVYSTKSFIIAVKTADQLQKADPSKRYEMKLMEDNDDDNG